ncbi:MAG TPA: DNA-3-methyladenine glycosylase 2 family protein [Thermoplasmata archaeon]|nr:DNA-3-methyladenine glycosylase 2 family protein [Thermoplasmata archaeon]
MAPSSRSIARHLGRSDPVMAGIIRRVGLHEPPVRPSGFPALARAIIYQQISGAAGASILRKIQRTAGTRAMPPPRWFLASSDATLRSAGISPQKIRYLRDLASHVVDRRIDFHRFPRMTDEEITEHVSAVHGIGRWTAQMFLLFSLGRPDVLPTGDLGVRRAVQLSYGYRALPAERTVERIGRPWAPWRSHATYYLWRSLENTEPVIAASR